MKSFLMTILYIFAIPFVVAKYEADYYAEDYWGTLMIIGGILCVIHIIGFCVFNDALGVELLLLFPAVISWETFFVAKNYCELNISPWWLFLGIVWAYIAILLPGGFTISTFLFKAMEFMVALPWVWIVSVLADIVMHSIKKLLKSSTDTDNEVSKIDELLKMNKKGLL